jgi:hypothetical protein
MVCLTDYSPTRRTFEIDCIDEVQVIVNICFEIHMDDFATVHLSTVEGVRPPVNSYDGLGGMRQA